MKWFIHVTWSEIKSHMKWFIHVTWSEIKSHMKWFIHVTWSEIKSHMKWFTSSHTWNDSHQVTHEMIHSCMTSHIKSHMNVTHEWINSSVLTSYWILSSTFSVAVGYSGLQWVAVGCSGLQCVAVGCSVLQWIALILVHHMGWLRLVGFLKLQGSFAKEPYKRDDIPQKRPIILRSLLIVATPYWYPNPQFPLGLRICFFLKFVFAYLFIWIYRYRDKIMTSSSTISAQFHTAWLDTLIWGGYH